jgi:hypothetical protein
VRTLEDTGELAKAEATRERYLAWLAGEEPAKLSNEQKTIESTWRT